MSHPVLRDRVPSLAEPVAAVLRQREHAWLVGGTVRDLLLEREPADVDLAAADAETIAVRFARSHSARAARIGRELGTWRVAAHSRYYDFAPVQGESIEADLARRDFTINAMAVGVREPGQLLDPFGGESDLRELIIRAVRESNLDDDPLRALRGLRFAMIPGAEIHPQTWEWIVARRRRLDDVAAERVRYELERMLQAAPGSAVTLLRASAFDDLLLGCRLGEPEQRAADSISASPDAVIQLLAAVAVSAGIDDVAARMRDRRWSTDEATRAAALSSLATRNWSEPAEHVLQLQRLQSHDASNLVATLRALERPDEADRLELYLSRLAEEWWGQRPLLSGDEIAERHGLSGPAIGRALAELLTLQLRGEIRTPDEARLAMDQISRSV